MNRLDAKTVVRSAPAWMAVITGCLSLWSATAQAEQRQLEVASGDLVVSSVVRHAPDGLALSQRPLQAARLLDPVQLLDGSLAVAEAASRSYWIEASATELRQGIRLPLGAGGALVRLQPVDGSSSRRSIEPAKLELIDSLGQAHLGASAFELLVDAEDMTPAPFEPGTSAFQLRSELGGGVWTVRAPEVMGSGAYRVHVFEPESPLALRLKADRAVYFDGQELRVMVRAESTEAQVAPRLLAVRGDLRAPNGQLTELQFAAGPDGSVVGRAIVQMPDEFLRGLWDLEVQAEGVAGELAFRRIARTQLEASRPTAAFSGSVSLLDDSAPAVSVGLTVGVAGRYEVRGVLFATSEEGQLVPASVAHSAAWLEPGAGTLGLTFSPLPDGLTHPVEVRDLRLMDQGRLALLERRGLAQRWEDF